MFRQARINCLWIIFLFQITKHDRYRDHHSVFPLYPLVILIIKLQPTETDSLYVPYRLLVPNANNSEP